MIKNDEKMFANNLPVGGEVQRCLSSFRLSTCAPTHTLSLPLSHGIVVWGGGGGGGTAMFVQCPSVHLRPYTHTLSPPVSWYSSVIEWKLPTVEMSSVRLPRLLIVFSSKVVVDYVTLHQLSFRLSIVPTGYTSVALSCVFVDG